MKKKPGACSLSGATPPPPLASAPSSAEPSLTVVQPLSVSSSSAAPSDARALARMEELLRTLLQAVEKLPAALAQNNPAAAASAGGGGGDALGAKLARIEERLDALASLGVRAAPSLDERVGTSPAPLRGSPPALSVDVGGDGGGARRSNRRESGGGYGGPDSPSMFSMFGGGDEHRRCSKSAHSPSGLAGDGADVPLVNESTPSPARAGARPLATQRRRPPISRRTEEDSRTRASRHSSSARRRAADAPSGRPSRRKSHSKARARSPSSCSSAVRRRRASTPTTPPASRRRASGSLNARRPRSARRASVDLLASVDDGTTVVDVEMGGGERRDSTASIPDLE